jgi:signal peptidase I
MSGLWKQNKAFILFMLGMLLMRGALADWNPVPTGSMRPTIEEGDVVLVNRAAFDLKLPFTSYALSRTGEPRRGDIVTFFSPRDGSRLIKRVVALPGDEIAMRGGRLVLNGKEALCTGVEWLAEPVDATQANGPSQSALRCEEQAQAPARRIQKLPQTAHPRMHEFGPVKLGPDEYFMMGDNRDNSLDSRYFGPVKRTLLIGRAHHLMVSFDPSRLYLPRWSRIAKPLV